jgi:hypothetical protein
MLAIYEGGNSNEGDDCHPALPQGSLMPTQTASFNGI